MEEKKAQNDNIVSQFKPTALTDSTTNKEESVVAKPNATFKKRSLSVGGPSSEGP